VVPKIGGKSQVQTDWQLQNKKKGDQDGRRQEASWAAGSGGGRAVGASPMVCATLIGGEVASVEGGEIH